MKRINIPLPGRSYDVLIGKNALGNITPELKKRKLNGRMLVIVDRNVLLKHSEKIRSAFQENADYFVLKPGEDSKSVEVLQQIYQFMVKKQYNRHSVVAAVGGGVTGDLAGFAAATYMRGLRFVQVPTTLLAAVDSSVGGKTGINFRGTKNIIGSFHQPSLVVTDLDFMSTLPEQEILCGFGEILKYAFLSGEDFFKRLKRDAGSVFAKDQLVIERLIQESVNIKKSVVLQDEMETGLRKILNLGHTFGHSFESVLNFGIKHGEAVIAGIICALRLSVIRNIMTEQTAEPLINFSLQYIRTRKLKDVNNARAYNIMLQDKKNSGGTIKFVLVNKPGKLFIDVPADKSEVFSVLNYFKELL